MTAAARSLTTCAPPDDDETIPTSPEGLLDIELRRAWIALDPPPASPRRHALRSRLETYVRIVESYTRSEVSRASRWALLELIVALREEAEELSARFHARFENDVPSSEPPRSSRKGMR
jgi:hypothetical protein